MKTEIVIPVATLVAGAAIGCAIACGFLTGGGPSGDETSLIERLTAENDAYRAKLADRDREIRRLKSRRTERRGAHGEGRGESPIVQVKEGEPEETLIAEEGENRRFERQDPREMMERFKKENPEGFARMTNQMARMRQMRRERAQAKLDFFDSIDISGMNAEDRAKTEALQGLLAKREELEARMRPDAIGEMSDEERDAFFTEMRETHDSIRALNGQVRSALLRQTVASLGLDEELSEDVALTVEEVIEATSGGGQGGPRGMGPRDGGRAGRGR